MTIVVYLWLFFAGAFRWRGDALKE